MTLKRIGILAGVILAVVLSVPYLVLVVVDQSDERAWITRLVSEATGREVTLDSADVEWGLRPEIRIEGIRVTHASQPRFQAGRVALKLSPHKLAAAGLGMLSLEVAGARIALGEGGGGRPGPARPGPAENVVGWALWLLGSILITDSEVIGGTEEGTWSLLLHEAGLNVRLDGSTGLRVHAVFQDMPLSFSGSAGGMSEIVSGQTVPLELSGHVGNGSNQVTISGRIHDVLQVRGLDLRVRANLVSLEGLPLAAKSGFPALTGEAHVVQEGAFDSMQLREVDIRSSGFGLGLRIHGEVGRVRNWQDVSLEVALDGSVTEPGILQVPLVGGRMEVDVRGSVSGAAGTMELVLSRGRVLTREIIAEISGTIGNPLGDWKTPAKLGLRMQPEASIIPGSLRALPPLSAEADLYWKSGRLETNNLWIRGGSSETGDIWLLGEGALHGIGRGMSGAISLSGSLDGTALEKLTGSDRLSDVSLIAQAGWSVEKGISRVDHIELEGSAPGLALSGTGSYPEPARPESLRMRFEVSGDSLGRLAGLLNTDLPQVGRFAGSAELAGSAEGLFRLENLALSVEDEALTAEVSGSLALTGPDLPLDLAFRSEIADPSLLKYYLGDLGILDEIGFLFPLSAGGTLLASAGPSGERRYTLEKLEVNSLSGTHDVQATGRVSAFNTPDRSGAVELLLSGSVSAEQDDRFRDWTGRFPFLRGNLEARTRVEIHPDRVEVGDLDLSIQGNRFSVSAQGTLESMDPFHVKRMTVRFSGDTLDDLYGFSDPGLNTDNPVRGELAIIGEGSGQRLDLDLSIAGDDLVASLRLEAAENDPARRRISGRISARSLDLTRILQPPEKTDRVFSSDPIGLAWAGLADIDLEIDIENFRNRVLELRRLEGSIRTLDGSMEVQASGLSDTRPLNLQVNLDRRPGRWDSRVRLHGEGVDMGMLPDLLAHQTRGGTFSVDLDLSGSGSTASQIAATANGQVYLDLDDARIKGGSLRLLSADFLLGVLDTARIWTTGSEWIDAECGAFFLEVENGVARTDRGMAIKFHDFTLIGGGQIDLSNEQLDIVFASKARKGLGINTNTLAKMVRVGGTIKNPEIGADSRGLFKTGLALGAALASGGLSLIAQGLLDKQVANSDVCQIVREQYDASPGIRAGSG